MDNVKIKDGQMDDLTVGSVFRFEYPNLTTMTLPSLAITGRCLVITKAWRTRI